MKNLIYILLITTLFSSCNVSKRYYLRDDYDMAIARTVKKLKKKPHKTKEILVLRDALKIANQKNNDKITYLKQSGQPDIWDEVFHHLNRLKQRQDLVKTIPSSLYNDIGFVEVDYDQELITAKRKAAEYFYVHAKSLLDKNDKANARVAYDELLRVKSYFNNYRDTDDLIQKALNIGTSYVLFKIQYFGQFLLPKQVDQELTKTGISELNSLWFMIDEREITGKIYDFEVILAVRFVNVSRESVNEKSYAETKEIEDGWQYAYDANGNVMKDTAGNDIKIKKYKTISCEIKEIDQHKTAQLSGTIDIINRHTKQVVKTEPIIAEMIFHNCAVIPYGDTKALKDETAKKIGGKVLPFPNDLQMLLDAGQILKKLAKEFVHNNKQLML